MNSIVTNFTASALTHGIRQAVPSIPSAATIILVSGAAIVIFKILSHFCSRAQSPIQESKTTPEPAPTLEPFSLGKATVFTADTPVKILITKKNANFGRIAFIASGVLKGKETELGSILLDWIRVRDNGIFGSEYYSYSIIGTLKTYGPDRNTSKWSKIYVVRVDNFVPDQNIKGIGTALMQAAVEYSFFKGCNGRLQLDAVRTSHIFHYKFGMRTGNSEVDNGIVELSARLQGKKPRRDFGCHDMHLPEAAQLLWKERIRKQPIFADTLSYLDQKV